MKLVMTLLVRDEADILSANIDFHLDRGVDFVIATDNLSVDGTREILENYQRQGVLHYIYESGDRFAQDLWVTRMARMACTKFGANWVINNDADEFWWPEEGNLKVVLALLSNEAVAAVAKRSNFLPAHVSPGVFFADIMTVREVSSLNALGKPLPPKVCCRAYPDIEVANGNHSVLRNGRKLPVVDVAIHVLHFPMRSYEQFANKISKGAASLIRNTNLPEEVGNTWRKLYEIWVDGELEDYYREQLLDKNTIGEGILTGRYVYDERLKDFFKNLRIKPAEEKESKIRK